MYDNTKVFEIKLCLCGNQLKLNDLVHIQHLKYLDAAQPENIQDCSQFNFLRRENFDEGFQDFKIMETELLMFALPLEAGIQKSAESMQKELINLKCNTNSNQKLSETAFQDIYSCCRMKDFCARILCVKDDCDIRQHV